VTLSPAQRATLDGLRSEDLRQQLNYAGASMGAVVPGLGDGMISRGDVLAYLAERDKREAKSQRRRDTWQKIWVSLVIAGVSGLAGYVLRWLTGG
jgi:hypothetical protein